jgi:hypothetical protein
MNCSIKTFMPLPTARSAVPMAAVVLPLPGPVFTMIRPRRTSAITEVRIVLGAGSFLPAALKNSTIWRTCINSGRGVRWSNE